MKSTTDARIVAGCLTALLAIAAVAGWSAIPPKSGLLQYEEHGAILNHPIPRRQSTIWFKGQYWRREATRVTPEREEVIDVNLWGPAGFLLLEGGHREWRKLHWKPRWKGDVPPIFMLPGGTEPKKIGMEKVGRYRTTIYERFGTGQILRGRDRPPETQRYRERLWRSPEFPPSLSVKRVIQTLKGKTVVGQTVWVLESARFNIPVPDALFRLPKNAKVVELSPAPLGARAPMRPSAKR